MLPLQKAKVEIFFSQPNDVKSIKKWAHSNIIVSVHIETNLCQKTMGKPTTYLPNSPKEMICKLRTMLQAKMFIVEFFSCHRETFETI